MKLKYRKISSPSFPWENYTEERNVEGWGGGEGLPHTLGVRNHHAVLKDSRCRCAIVLLLLRSQAGWRLSHKLELNEENGHHLDLGELWLYLPSGQHPRHTHHAWPTRFHFSRTSPRPTFIPTPLSKLKTKRALSTHNS